MDSDAARLIELGRAAYDGGDLAEAARHFAAAQAAGDRGLETNSMLGYLALTRGETDTAARYYEAALEQAPADGGIASNLADLRRQQGRFAEAVALFRRAIALAPEHAEIRANLGALLISRHRMEEAVTVLEQALRLNPSLVGAHADIATALCCLNRYEEAPGHYRAIAKIHPANNSARYMEALALLALGDFENGWRKHEVRWFAEMGEGHRLAIHSPSWDGQEDVAGRTILLHAEQGFGDTVMFCRYVPMVAARGARVVLMAPQPLCPLLTPLPGVAEIMAYGQASPPPYDTHSSLMSLPWAFRTRIDTVPATVPYLYASPEARDRWAARLGPRDGRRRVAIAWSGSDSVWNRALPLEALAPLLARDDTEFHVAQTEIRDPDRAAMTAFPQLRDHSRDLADFADTAGLLSQMDMVISVDTVLVHLAGAMALPVWTMLPFGCDYRWMTKGTTSPWYPTMRLFRQPRFLDWAGLIAQVCAALDIAPDTAPDTA